jgi:hypothetical protein
VVREDEGGLTLCYNKRSQQRRLAEEEYDDSRIYDRNPYLHQIVNRCQIPVIEKEVVACPKINSNDSYYNAKPEIRHELQGSFAGTKELLKKNLRFLNGQFIASEERGRLVPQLKAERVYPVRRD